MRVKEIVIDGFKSYAKRTVITNWDPQFNCITGLNGSGKSNILDAICFVLGITAMSTVRAQNQQDLIYKRGQAGVTKASVSIVFDNTDKAKSPMDYRMIDTITVTRQVVLGGTSKYLINGHRAQQAQVQQLFQEVQLNVNNPNFLIMQGQITKVVNMRPTEILGLIEEAAGTGMYEKERMKAMKEINDRDLPLHETESLLNEEVRPKLEKLRSQKRQFLEYQQCAASTESLEKVLAVSEYNFHKYNLSKLEEEVEERAIRTEELKAQLNTETYRCAEVERKLLELKSSQQTQEAVRLDTELQAANEEYARMATDLEHKQNQLSTLEEEIARNHENSVQLARQLKEYESNVEGFESAHATLRSQLDKQHAYVDERRELLTGLQTGISTTGERETGYAYSTKRARERLADSEQHCATLNAERGRLETTLAKENLSELEQKYAENQKHLEKIHKVQQEKQAELDQLGESVDIGMKLKDEQHRLNDEAAKITRELERIMARYPNLDIPNNNPQIKGRVAHIFRVLEDHESKSLALEVCAGGGIWSLVVNNEKVGAEVLKNARKRMSVLPLNRMRSQVIKHDIIQQIDPQGAWIALDLLGFDEDVRPAMEFVFGRTVICATSAIAERAAFKFGIRSVTLEGDVFDPRGIVSGGFQGIHGQSQSTGGCSVTFNAVKQYQFLVQQKVEIESRLYEVEQKLISVGDNAIKAEQLRNELALADHESQLTTTRLTDFQTRLDHIKKIRNTLEELVKHKIPAAEKEVEMARSNLEKVLKDAAEFNANRDDKLKELRTEVERAVAEDNRLSELLERQATQHSQNQTELARLRADLSQEETEQASNQYALSDLRQSLHIITTSSIPEVLAQITKLEQMLKEENLRLAATRRDMQDGEEELLELKSRIAEMRLEIQQATHLQEKQGDILTGARASLNQVLKKWSWAPEAAKQGPQQGPQSLSQVPQPLQAIQFTDDTTFNDEKNRLLEQLRQNFAQEQRRLQSLASKVDSSVVTMIERLETDEKQLRQRLETIREDRRKLEESMETLNERRRRTIDSVWRQVSHDFGLIFGDLLPQSSCELVPLSDQPIKNGFTIRVCLGATWKEGLTELSGGQRSLVALALILALLRYHPAPVYILDEVDAALDVHHTRNIGYIIKTRFQNAQFIVVSLKDDMFTNANRIYQTRFIDGTSTVVTMA